jgi:hypothetical protein
MCTGVCVPIEVPDGEVGAGRAPGVALTLPALARVSMWQSLRMSYHWVRFYYWCHRYTTDAAYRQWRLATYGRETWRAFLTHLAFDREFLDDVLYPVVAAICTCSYAELDAYPAPVIIEFFGLGLFFEGGSVVTKGVREARHPPSQREREREMPAHAHTNTRACTHTHTHTQLRTLIHTHARADFLLLCRSVRHCREGWSMCI